MQVAMIVPISSSPLAEMVATCAKSVRVSQGRLWV
jgi:hypothetical protein